MPIVTRSANPELLTEDKMGLHGKHKKKVKHGSHKIEKVMGEHKRGTLRSSSGKKVTSREQALAIALSESRAMGEKIPKKKRKR